MAIIIPRDVLFHRILPRLPTKSVSRFKCASKELRSFLSSNVFKKMHSRHRDYHQNHNKFIVLPHDASDSGMLSAMDCEAPLDNVITPTSFKLPAMASSSKEKIKFLTSFHGLVCLYIPIKNGYHVHYDIILWNPLTSEYKRLSKPNSRMERSDIRSGSTLGLYYSSCEDDYKLAILSPNPKNKIVYIYSLKANSWRRVPVQGIDGLEIHHALESTYLNKNLYFLCSDKKYSVMKFDTKTERFTEMKTTSGFNNIQNRFRSTLMVEKGCIHVCIVYNVGKTSFETEFWKITEEGDWKKMESYRVDSGFMSNMKPLHMRSNGNMLMLGYKHSGGGSTYNCKGFLYNVDLKKKHSKGEDNEARCRDMEISEIVRYTETFVSPNQYIE